MYRTLRIAVVIPALNEKRLLLRTLRDVPQTIDSIHVVDDGNVDTTAELVLEAVKSVPQINPLRQSENRDVGAAIITGDIHAFNNRCDVSLVVGVDAQMDSVDVDNLPEPIASAKSGQHFST